MKSNFRCIYRHVLLALLMVIVIQFVWSPILWGQKEVVKQFQFKKVMGINIQVLTREAFQQKFGDNLLIPRTNDEVIQLARKIYRVPIRKPIEEECGEPSFGVLFAALTNPDITDETRDEVDSIIDASIPSLPKTYTEGHFKFYYTTNDTDRDQNVTLNNVKETAKILNNAWDDYATNFTEPKHYVTGGGCSAKRKMIDVKVYYCPYYGATASSWDHIDLNSKLVVNESCKRQTTPVHELFHRVQYSYGYVTQTANMSWATEGTASWSQKYRASNVGDWMYRMNQGLGNPDRSLIAERSYDACHFWCYLGQQGNGEMPTIREVWSTYQTNGNKMKDAVEATIKNRVPNGSSMDQFVGWWVFTNVYKDISNASASFDYEEDEWSIFCNKTYGPLREVLLTAKPTVNSGTNYSHSDNVSAYGADYYVFKLGTTLNKIEIKVSTTSKNFGYAIVEIKNNTMINYQRTPAGSWEDYDYTKTLSSGQLSHIALIVIGNPNGGNYTVTVNGS